MCGRCVQIHLKSSDIPAGKALRGTSTMWKRPQMFSAAKSISVSALSQKSKRQVHVHSVRHQPKSLNVPGFNVSFLLVQSAWSLV